MMIVKRIWITSFTQKIHQHTHVDMDVLHAYWFALVQGSPKIVQDALDICQATPQSPKWHPEGNVYNHTMIVTMRLVMTGDINLIIAGLTHDLGKATKTVINDNGLISAHKHEVASVDIVDETALWIEAMGADVSTVRAIVADHMRVKNVDVMSAGKAFKMKTSPHYPPLSIFAIADSMKGVIDNNV